MNKLPIEYVIPLMERVSLAKNGKPISKTAFGKLADVHNNGRRVTFHVFHFGIPRENQFAFYPPYGCSKKEALDIAYECYLDCFTENKQEFVDGNVCWGNLGIPITLNNRLRVNEPSMLVLIKTL